MPSFDKQMNQSTPSSPPIDAIDRALIVATQAGLPLVPRPFHALGKQLGISAALVQQRLRTMQRHGIIRRIAAIPNHYSLGYRANGMSVWDIPDESIATLGAQVGALDFVSHCYHRPRHPPHWPYCLFAMVHARTRGEVYGYVSQIAELLGPAVRQYDVLYSTRILKKAGLRLAPQRPGEKAIDADQGGNLPLR